MKQLAGLLAVLLLLLHHGGALAQSSDYEIIQTYKGRHQALMESIRTARERGQAGTLETEISSLEAEYAPHRKLLGDGLYPETLGSSIGALRDQLKKTTDQLALVEEREKDKATIETISRKAAADETTIVEITRQNADYRVSLEKLTLEVSGLSARIQQLSAENTGLLEKIKVLQLENRKDRESIAKLKELVEKLNANIRDRNDLIVRMMDGLFSEYSKSNLTDAQKKDLFIDAQGNDYVGKIIETIDGNVSSVARTVMLPQDVELIKGEQLKVTSKWNAIKPYVGKLYPDDLSRDRDLGRVESRLADWKKHIAETTWKSIQQVFLDRKIDIGTFGTADEFQARLLAYLDEQVKNPSRARYQAFKTGVWDSPIKDKWLPVIPTDELTAKQRGDIEERIDLWGKKVSALVWRWVLIGAFGLAVVAVILVVISRRKKPAPAAV